MQRQWAHISIPTNCKNSGLIGTRAISCSINHKSESPSQFLPTARMSISKTNIIPVFRCNLMNFMKVYYAFLIKISKQEVSNWVLIRTCLGHLLAPWFGCTVWIDTMFLATLLNQWARPHWCIFCSIYGLTNLLDTITVKHFSFNQSFNLYLLDFLAELSQARTSAWSLNERGEKKTVTCFPFLSVLRQLHCAYHLFPTWRFSEGFIFIVRPKPGKATVYYAFLIKISKQEVSNWVLVHMCLGHLLTPWFGCTVWIDTMFLATLLNQWARPHWWIFCSIYGLTNLLDTITVKHFSFNQSFNLYLLEFLAKLSQESVTFTHFETIKAWWSRPRIPWQAFLGPSNKQEVSNWKLAHTRFGHLI